MPARRIEVADALRAFALAGILQVNIQSFAWGAGDPLGYFAAPPSPLDQIVYLLISTFVSGKFISIFAFLFGFGFALQWRSMRRRAARIEDTVALYRRRLWFLLVLGLAHGVLLYYGDILAAYALCGFVLLHYAQARPAALAASTVRWWLAFAALTIVTTAVFELSHYGLAPEVDPTQLPEGALERFTVYTEAGFGPQIAVRLGDYVSVLAAIAALAVPQLVGLFLLGALAGRLGWLAHPQRHARLWRMATWIGIAALPIALLAAWLIYDTIRSSPGDPSTVGYAVGNVGALLACLYVALFVRGQQHPVMRRCIAWLAPAGRMPLTNYIAQSAIMGAMLSGWGLGLGNLLTRAQLAALALAIVATQIVASRWWISNVGQGPLEALWRRATYGAQS